MTVTIQAQRNGGATEISKTTCCGTTCCEDAGEQTEALSPEAIKTMVREKYAAIAREADASCGCSDDCCGENLTMIGDAYEGKEGYVADADLGLGCGLPTDLAGMKLGDTVLDLGAGAGIDAFIARTVVGEHGRVIGVDMTPEMIDKARNNAAELGFGNVEFLQGDIESLPLDDGLVDVVVSNCVLNLVPDKAAAFSEMYRVLKPGGHFTVSDIVVRGELPASIRDSAALYAGCVAGAIQESAYLDLLREAGFSSVRVLKEKPIVVPDETLRKWASAAEIEAFRRAGDGIVSVTVHGERVG